MNRSWSSSLVLFLWLGASWFAGCKEKTPSAENAVPSAPSAVVTALSAAPTVSHVPPSPSAQTHPENCEVEFFGQVSPVDAKLPLPIVFASTEDCIAPTGKNIGQTQTQPDGKFFLEVFVKWGSDLTLCAFQPQAGGPEKPTKLYGKAAGPFHAEKSGEVEFKDTKIELKSGAARPFPKVKPGGAY